jgi:hypothetical protein
MVASNPPADPPMPTMGTLKFSFKGFERDVRRAGFADFVRLGFFREGDALLFDVRFAAMAFFMLSAAWSPDKARFARDSGGDLILFTITARCEIRLTKNTLERFAECESTKGYKLCKNG